MNLRQHILKHLVKQVTLERKGDSLVLLQCRLRLQLSQQQLLRRLQTILSPVSKTILLSGMILYKHLKIQLVAILEMVL